MKFYFSGYDFHKDSSQQLSESNLQDLSNHIGKDWKRFARHVGIEENEIEEIMASRNSRSDDRCLKVFTELKRRQGLVKWNQVKKAMEELGLNQRITYFASNQLGIRGIV